MYIRIQIIDKKFCKRNIFIIVIKILNKYLQLPLLKNIYKLKSSKFKILFDRQEKFIFLEFNNSNFKNTLNDHPQLSELTQQKF